jgi:hypothetical protein
VTLSLHFCGQNKTNTRMRLWILLWSYHNSEVDPESSVGLRAVRCMSLPHDPSQTLLDHSTLTQGTLLWLCTMYKLHIVIYKAWFSLSPIYLVYFGLTNTNLDTLLHTGHKNQGALHFRTICSYSATSGLQNKYFYVIMGSRQFRIAGREHSD